MDILKDLKEFILQDGLKNWIEKFRNPDKETFFFCEAKYDPKTDSRIYYYEEEHPSYYTYALTGSSNIVSIETAFKNYLNGRLREFEKRKEDLLFLVIDDLPLLKEFASHSSDYTMLRHEAKKVSPLPALTELLIIHIGKMEAVYKDFIVKAGRNGNAAYSKSLSDKLISFGYKGSNKVLLLFYCELKLEKGDFINRELTKLDVFTKILTSFNVKEEKGSIHFGCESKQAAYILSKLQSFFSNLSFTAIEQSNKFYSKNGTLIKADSLSKYINEAKEVKEKSLIDNFFTSLPKK